MQGIQIIGTQRSGSNVLRLMLNELAEVAAPHPPHIIKNFHPLLDVYGDLSELSVRHQLATDISTFISLNPVPWQFTDFDAQEIAERAGDLPQMMCEFYARYAQGQSADHWCCKSLNNVHHIAELESADVELKYIHLYRDGRDVALSFQNALVGEKHCYQLAQQWSTDQQVAMHWQQELGEERCLSISYEELLHDPELTMQNVCNFIGVEYEESTLLWYESEESRNTASAGRMWSNLSRPLIRDNFGKYKDELTSDEIAIFETIAGDTLVSLGYELNDLQAVAISEEDLVTFEHENNQMKEDARQLANPSDLEKRIRQQDLLESIANRVAT